MPSTNALSSSDRIELLQTFVLIVETGSLSAAAAQMGTTQPTVSRRLQALERHFGVRLLNRSTHAMRLTEDGQRCLARAKDLLTSWQAFDAELRGVENEPEGTLRVVVPHAFGQEVLVGPLADYLRTHSRVAVEWLLHDRQPDFITEGIDCAIHVGAVTDLSVVALKLAEVARIPVVAPAVLSGRALPQHPSELDTLPWLALGTYYRSEVQLIHARTGEAHTFAIAPRLNTDSLYALRHAALHGLGACVGSGWIFTEDLTSGRLVQLVPEWQAAPLPVYLTYPHARFQPAKLRRFLALMRKVVPALMQSV